MTTNTFSKNLAAFSGIIFAFAFCLLLIAFYHDWTWSLYDDMEWVDAFHRFKFLDFISFDWISNGRVRPLSLIYSNLRFLIFGTDAQTIHFIRSIENILFYVVLGLFLRSLKISSLWIAATLCLVLKSPTSLEQFRWISFHEIWGCTFVLFALIIYKKNKHLSYLLLALATLFKEPFAIFLALPSALNNETNKTFASLILSFTYLFVLYLFRHGYSSTYSIHSISISLLLSLLKGSFIDLAPFALLLFGLQLAKPARQATIPVIFGLAYYALVTPKAWGYSYMHFPAIVLVLVGLITYFSQLQIKHRRVVIAFLFLSAFVLPLRLVWSWTKTYKTLSSVNSILTVLQKPFSTNCYNEYFYQKDGKTKLVPIHTGVSSISQSCTHAKSIAVFQECSGFHTLAREMKQSSLNTTIFQNNFVTFCN
ncbi:MAG: hypothetical protein AB7F43_02325 [Bacteriovoracia bacterium]